MIETDDIKELKPEQKEALKHWIWHVNELLAGARHQFCTRHPEIEITFELRMKASDGDKACYVRCSNTTLAQGRALSQHPVFLSMSEILMNK